MTTSDTETDALKTALERIRPGVREEKAYRVGLPSGIKYKLNQNESPYDLPEEVKDELFERFKEVEFNRYPSDQPDELAERISEYNGYPSEGILIGNGSNELTYTIGLALIEKGSPVVLPRPMFSLYEAVVRLYGGDLIGIPPRDDLTFDTDAIITAISDYNPPLTVLTTPNNPTGLAMPRDEVEAIVEAASGIVVVDEAYVEFNPSGDNQPLLEKHPNVILMRTFSKAFGLAGMRIGYLMAHPEVIDELMKARLPFMVDRFAEITAHALLERSALVEERAAEIRSATQQLTAALQNMEGIEVKPSEANFVIFKTAPDPDAVQDFLADEGVLIRNMGGYPELQGYLRVNAGAPEENKAFLAALEKALTSLDPA